MAFDIDNFRAAVNELGGIVRPNTFQAEIQPPKGMLVQNLKTVSGQNASQNDASGKAFNLGVFKTLAFMCDTANLPGIYLTGPQTMRYGYGIPETSITNVMFHTLDLSFLFDGRSVVWDFFSAWMKLIVNYDNRAGSMYATTGVGAKQQVYEVSYKEEYATDISISVFNQKGKVIKKIKFLECFPVAITEEMLSWAAQNQHMKVHVTILYRDWHDELNMITNNANRT